MENSIDAQEIPLVTNIEALAISVLSPKKLHICNIYIPPNSEINSTELNNLIEQIPKPRIILGDFNSHNIIWGSDTTNPKGRILDSLMDKCNLIALNNGEKTRFNSFSGTSSVLDLSFCDPSLSTSFSFEVLPYLYGSDHFPIKLTSEQQPNSCTNPIQKWNLKKADWPLFRSIVENEISQCQIHDNINKTVEVFTETLIKAAEKAIGKTSYIKNRNPVPWWSPECEKALKQSKQAFNRYKKHKTLENLLTFKQLRAKTRYIIKKSKKDSWTKYVSSINSSTPLSTVWNKIKKIKGTNPYQGINVLIHEGNTISSKKEIAETLADVFHENSSNINYDKDFLTHKISEESQDVIIDLEDNNLINAPIILEELEDALNSFKNSSPGPDDIPFIFLQNLPLNAKQHLLNILNILWRNNKFPQKWSEAIVIPILKPNKPKSNPESYRPIALTCTMCKLLEKITNRRLMWFLEHKRLIASEQSGFRKYRSTVDNLIDMESYIHEAFINKQKCIGIFLDINKAYDTAWKYHIIKKLHSWGLDGNILAFINNFLKNRSFKVRANGVLSEKRYQENGIPQGSSLSVTLFLVAINDITEYIKPPVRVRVYADDLVLISRGKNMKTIQRNLQLCLNAIETWSKNSGFKFSTHKSKCLLFSKQADEENPILSLHNKNIRYEPNIKFLGMTFDQKLTWGAHIKNLKQTCQNGINLLKTLANQNWGADRTTLLHIYRALIRSRIDYGAIVYASASKSLLKTIDSIHNTAIRIALGAYRTSPTESLYCESGEPPLVLRRQYLSLSYASAVSANPHNVTYDNVFSTRFKDTYQKHKRSAPPFYERINRSMDDLQILFPKTYPVNVATTPPWIISPPLCNTYLTLFKKTETAPSIILNHFSEILSKYSSHLILYTDASKIQGDVGAGVVAANFTRMYRLPPTCSIFSGELYAILQALICAKEQDKSKIVIITDSLSALNGLKQIYPDNPLLSLIKDELYIIQQLNKTVEFIWVPSHIGITGNEEADKTARRAINDQDAIVVTTTLHTDLKCQIKHLIKNAWQLRWQQSKTKLREVKPTIKPWTSNPKRRKVSVILTRLRIGHTRYTHEHLLKKTEEIICEICKTKVSVKHFLIECPKYKSERQKNNIDPNLERVLGEDCNIANLMAFLSEINIVNKL